jgi:hypothetical protein
VIRLIVRSLAVLSVVSAAPLVAQQQRVAGQTQTVQVGVRVQPETVTVGDRFTALVRVRAPAGATIDFPAGPDSGATVELSTPVQFSQPQSDSVWIQQTAGYRLAAWDIGSQPVRLGDVVVRVAGSERRVPLRAAVFVRSVLPADTALHVPKPARPAITWAWPKWLLWLLAALAAALALLLAWWVWRAFRKKRAAALPPFEVAEREFNRVEALQLPERDEGARHVALMTDVMRFYLAARLDDVHVSHTGREMLSTMRFSGAGRWDPALFPRAERLLARAELAKFAAARIPGEEARVLGGEARALVHETERRLTAPEERAAA